MTLFRSLSAVALLFTASLALGQSGGSVPTIKVPEVGVLPEKMQMHGTAVVGERLYVFGGDLAGGIDKTLWTTNVHSAAINKKTLKLEDWRAETSLPEMRAYLPNCVEVINDRIYLLGGLVAKVATEEKSGALSKTVVWTRVQADGTLSPWTAAEEYPAPSVMFTSTCSDDAHIYVVGGYLGNVKNVGTKVINMADIKADGSLANWRKAGDMPLDLYMHGSSIQRGRLYVWGGQMGKSVANSRTFSCALAAGGEVGAWREEAAMPSGVYGATYCGLNDFIVSVGGRYSGSVPTNDIWFSRLDSTEVKTWQTVHTDIKPTVYHSLGLFKELGCVFITGGMIKRGSQSAESSIVDSVQAFQIPQPETSKLNLAVATGANAGMSSYPDIDTALKRAATENKQVLAFFYSPAVPACKEFWNAATSNPGFADLQKKYIIAAVNSADSNSDWASKLGVFRVPSMVLISAQGKRVQGPKRVDKFQDVLDLIAAK